MSNEDINDCPQIMDDFIAAMRGAGIRLTNQRRTILEWVAGMASTFTISQAVEALKRHGIGQATVYRTLSILEKLGLLRKASVSGYENRFISSRPGHHHSIICDSCGAVEEFHNCGWSLLKELLSLQTGFDVHDHYLEVHGTCSACRKIS